MVGTRRAGKKFFAGEESIYSSRSLDKAQIDQQDDEDNGTGVPQFEQQELGLIPVALFPDSDAHSRLFLGLTLEAQLVHEPDQLWIITCQPLEDHSLPICHLLGEALVSRFAFTFLLDLPTGAGSLDLIADGDTIFLPGKALRKAADRFFVTDVGLDHPTASVDEMIEVPADFLLGQTPEVGGFDHGLDGFLDA